MLSPAEKAKAWALQQVGCPYLMGGTGCPCTPAYRHARALQYPAFAGKIRKNCPRTNGQGAASCLGCPYFDAASGKGRPAYDCAQLTRCAMEAAGLSLCSGATSQWQKTPWQESGPLSSLPKAKVCLLFRQDAPGRMGHTGLYLGDGTAVHAKGHDAGVVREPLNASGRWTHWALPRGLYPQEPPQNSFSEPLQPYVVTGKRLALRSGPGLSYPVLTRIATGERLLGAASGPKDGWIPCIFRDQKGFCMAAFLLAEKPLGGDAPIAPDAPPDSSFVSLSLPRPAALALAAALRSALSPGNVADHSI